MPLATSVRANVSLFSTYSSRMSSRSIASERSRGNAAAAATRATARRGMRCAMPPTTPERYAVVSCHVERPLDDNVWAELAAAPGAPARRARSRGADAAAGPGRRRADEETWLRRAREAARRGPFGHHTHFTSPTHARPTGGDPGARVRREGAWLTERGLVPTLFCGGGWYTDDGVATACADARLRRLHAAGRATLVPRGGRRLGTAGRARPDRARRPHPLRRADVSRRGRPRPGARPARAAPARPCVLPRHGPRRAAPARAHRRRADAARQAAAGDDLDAVAATGLADAPRAGWSERRARGGRRPPGVESGRADRGAITPARERGGSGRLGRRPPLPRLPPLARAAARPRASCARASQRSSCADIVGPRARRLRSRSSSGRSSTATRSTGRCSGTTGPGRVAAVPRSRSPCSSSSRPGSTRRASAAPGPGGSLGALVLVALIVLAFGLGTDYDFTTTGLIPTAVVASALAIGLLRAAYGSIALELMRVAGVASPARARRARARRSPTSNGSSGPHVAGSRSRSSGPCPTCRPRRVARPARHAARGRATGRAGPRRGRLRRAGRARRRPARAPARREGRLAPSTTELLVHEGEYVPGQGVPLFELRPPLLTGVDWA